MAITRDDQLLLGRGPSWPERMYSLLAGFVEPGETIEAAVRRETLEESAIKVGPVRYVASQPWPFPMSLMFGCHGEAISEAITIDPVELSDARWVTRDEVLDILAGTHPESRPAGRRHRRRPDRGLGARQAAGPGLLGQLSRPNGSWTVRGRYCAELPPSFGQNRPARRRYCA